MMMKNNNNGLLQIVQLQAYNLNYAETTSDMRIGQFW